MLIVSMIAAFVSGVLAFQLGRQYLSRRKPHQLAWTIAMVLFFLGTGCQFLAEYSRWTPNIYRVWYLSGAILTAAYLGQGSLYLMNKSRVAHWMAGILVLSTIFAAYSVFNAPVDLNTAINSGGIASGKGMPQAIRLLTPFFNTYGTIIVVVGAFKSSWYFLWTGGDNKRAAGTGLIAIGTLTIAIGGTIARLSQPVALYITELVGITLIFIGFSLTNAPFIPGNLSAIQLKKRRRRISIYGVGFGVIFLLGSIISLPLLPWTMGIVGNVRHIYVTEVPDENRGVYLVTDNGVMQLYTWSVEPSEFPGDAPTLNSSSIQSIAIVQKQFSAPEDYRLYNLSNNQLVNWSDVKTTDMQMYLSIRTSSLTPGEYVLLVPKDSMFGGTTFHYFRLQ